VRFPWLIMGQRSVITTVLFTILLAHTKESYEYVFGYGDSIRDSTLEA